MFSICFVFFVGLFLGDTWRRSGVTPGKLRGPYGILEIELQSVLGWQYTLLMCYRSSPKRAQFEQTLTCPSSGFSICHRTFSVPSLHVYTRALPVSSESELLTSPAASPAQLVVSSLHPCRSFLIVPPSHNPDSVGVQTHFGFSVFCNPEPSEPKAWA